MTRSSGCKEALDNRGENGYAERLTRTIKEEEVDPSEYHNAPGVVARIKCFPEEVYQNKRIDLALGYLTSIEFETA